MAIQFDLGEPIYITGESGYVELMEYFVNRTDAYACQRLNGYCKYDEQLTYTILNRHIKGETTIGSYQLNSNGDVKWICFDIDCHDSSERERAIHDTLILGSRLKEYGIPYAVESSGTNLSYHFWVFLNSCPVSIAYAFGNELAYDIDCEVYPKQSDFDPGKPYGNLVKLPLGINRKVNKRSRIVYVTDQLRKLDLSIYTPSHVTKTIKHVDRITDMDAIVTVDVSTKSNSQILPMNVRPCIQAAVDGEIDMSGGDGHALRCAIVPELRVCNNMSVNEIVKVFKTQSDFDYNKTYQQVRSLYNYNRTRCKRLQLNSFNLISKYCENCYMR